MATRSPERKLFNKYRDELVAKLGRQAQDSGTLDKIGRAQFGPAWGGVWPVDRVKLKPNMAYIVNTDPHDKPGEHWIAVWTSATRAYIYDSYGRSPKRIVSRLLASMNRDGFQLGGTNRVARMEQIGYTSQICGCLAMAWLLVVRDLGIRRAANI